MPSRIPRHQEHQHAIARVHSPQTLGPPMAASLGRDVAHGHARLGPRGRLLVGVAVGEAGADVGGQCLQRDLGVGARRRHAGDRRARAALASARQQGMRAEAFVP